MISLIALQHCLSIMASSCHLLLLLLFNVVMMTTMAQLDPEPIGPWIPLPYAAGIQREVSVRHACSVMVEYFNQANEQLFLHAQISFTMSLSLLSPEMEAYTQQIWIYGHLVRQYYCTFLATLRQGGILAFLVEVEMLLAVPTDLRLSYNILHNVIPGTVHYKYTIIRTLQPGERLY
ncbi:hypothetical protein AXF42_Ash011066 [Apostasia shenzhenica]|uniref:Uncharacterized protein n=1 Tax=Apostasia shenzhenica TaxID=1088818 RepID=A0A2H9ZR02_9ASPA|nr:hypothetical protein AXF42_Ash011066 [Apostasia shenzhenica]